MAVAWKRLSEGRPEERDILLLKHELLEMKHEKNGKYRTLSEAHHQANKTYDWESILEKECGGQEANDLL